MEGVMYKMIAVPVDLAHAAIIETDYEIGQDNISTQFGPVRARHSQSGLPDIRVAASSPSWPTR
jgi:hypothetical protein